ncbi:hypothetical protein HY485_03475 [Candidatus Woesearchaeota archaeon]|nr:hypothetical protein [Candidatus Woesearchaeota archaeon]
MPLIRMRGAALSPDEMAKLSSEVVFFVVLLIIFVLLVLVIMNLNYFFPSPNPEELARSLVK